MKTLKNKLLVALVVAFMLTLGAAIIPTVGMQVNAAETDSVQITLTDGIAVKYYATLGADVTTATATFESETTALNATVKGEKVDDKWLFVYNKVTPQYVDATFSVKVNGEVRKENYSVLEYLNTIINGEYAQAEKTVAKDLVYYGEAAKAYKFGGEVTATPGTEYKGESKMSLGAKFADDTTIYSATVVFDTLPAITFGFKKASETATVTIDGKDVTNELAKGENGVYTYTLTSIYAVEFDGQYNVVLTDGEKTQTLLYSINDYAARMLSSANEAMKTLAKALYCYGAGAQALKTYQEETYVVVTAPTYTETGVAKNGKGEEITLPVLNAANYNFAQKTKDGADYAKDDYAKGTLGTAYFTHKAYPEIVIEKEITADTITFNWTDYNNVDINFRKTPEGMSAKYVDGVYVFTLAKGITIPNFSKLSSVSPSVKITGNGKLIVSHTKEGVNDTSATNIGDLIVDGATFEHKNTINANNVTVTGENASLITVKMTATGDIMVKGGTLTVTNGNLAIKSNKTLEVASGATLNVSSAVDRVVDLAAGVVARLYGTVSITYTGTENKCALGTNSGSMIYLAETSLVSISSTWIAIGCWNGKAYLYYPSTATKTGNNIKMGDKALLTCVRGGTYKIEFVAES